MFPDAHTTDEVNGLVQIVLPHLFRFARVCARSLSWRRQSTCSSTCSSGHRPVSA